MRSFVFGALLAALAPCAAAAQDAAAPCAEGTPSFATTAANRLSCEDVRKLRQGGAAFVMMRRHAQRPNCELRLTRPATTRDDGSFVQFCEIRCRGQGGRGQAGGFDWRPCMGDGSAARTTGVSACKNGVVCGGALGMGREAETCTTFHRDGDRYAIAWVSGRRSCLPGDLTVKPR